MARRKILTPEEQAAVAAEQERQREERQRQEEERRWACPKCNARVTPVEVPAELTAIGKIVVGECPTCHQLELVGGWAPIPVTDATFNVAGALLSQVLEILERLKSFDLHVSGTPNAYLMLAQVNGAWEMAKELMGSNATEIFGALFPVASKIAARGEVSMEHYMAELAAVKGERDQYKPVRKFLLKRNEDYYDPYSWKLTAPTPKVRKEVTTCPVA